MRLHKKIISLAFFAGIIAMIMPIATANGAVMNDYCVTPPFVTNAISPNVLIVLDNSGSMNDRAYASTYDPTQFTNGLYYGYFDPNQNYEYTANGRWEVTSLPMTSGTSANPIANGSFLNWATMRRVDVAKKLLIGGKASPRSPSGSVTVKLYGENGSYVWSWNFSKDFDNTSIPGLIYPFVGNYRYRMSGPNLRITPLQASSNYENVFPNGDISVPSMWTIVGASNAWDAVDDNPADGNTTYIKNAGTTINDHVVLDYSYTPGITGTIASVIVKVRARKTRNWTRRVRGVLRVNGTDYTSGYVNLRTYYRNYNFTFTTNPDTGAAWQWSDFKPDLLAQLDGFGVETARNNSASNHVRVTQVYLQVTVSTPSGGPYSIIVDQGMQKAQGIIDTLSSDVRFGLSYYNQGCGSECGYSNGRRDGAHVENYIDFGAAVNMVTSISGMHPDTWTPLAETLYEMIGYFRQDNPYYPGNSPADYQTGINYDPYYYQYSKLAGSGLGDQYVPCAKSFVLLLTDGESTKDQNIPVKYQDYDNDGNDPGSYPSNGTDYLDDVALWARTKDMRPGACTTTPTSFDQCIPGNQNIYLYSVFMFGKGSQLLKDAAINGGFKDLNGDGAPGPSLNEYTRDSNGDGVIDSSDLPLTYYEGDDGYALEKSIKKAITDILRRASAGTAASVLASSEGRGANLIQAVFYPIKGFDNDTEVSWISQMQNLWYYIDPRLQNSAMREDTTPDKIQNLEDDYTIHFRLDASTDQVMIDRYMDTDNDRIADTFVDSVELNDVKSLWDAGEQLFSRNLATNPRTIYTTTDGLTLTSFLTLDTTNPVIQSDLQAASQAEADDIINYIQGFDKAGLRNRTVTEGTYTGVWKLGDIVSSTPKVQSSVNLNSYDIAYKDYTYKTFINSDHYKNYGMAYAGANDGMLHAFKFGKFEVDWGQDKTFEVAKLSNPDPLTGAIGDEMWAFIPKNALPYLKYLTDPDYCHLYYVDATPYLFDASINKPAGCLGNYWNCTRKTTIDAFGNLDTSQTSWRTILIGGMRLGGGCKDTTYTGSYGVKLPVAGIGYSSYFALDVTDPQNPQLLWEFSNPDLGFSTSGPAIVRIDARKTSASNPAKSVVDTTKNGRWFVVFASGPTGPIDTGSHEFKGYSDQNLKLFILDLAGPPSGTWTLNSDYWVKDTGISNAFGGSLNNATVDYDIDYQDDAVYLGYTKAETGSLSNSSWLDGGVVRLVTRGDLDSLSEAGTALNPANWSSSTVISGVGAVNAAVTHLARYSKGTTYPKEGWVFFGSGRYFRNKDDLLTQRHIFGIKDPCVTSSGFDPSCTLYQSFCSNPVNVSTCGDIENVTTNVKLAQSDELLRNGWYLNLEAPGNTQLSGAGESNVTPSAERVITDPLATPIGVVFFTTFAPTSDICAYGGNTYLWALKYDTGSEGASMLRGSALLQVSTGAIAEISLHGAFNDKKGKIISDGGRVGQVETTGRRSGAISGIPPTGQGLAIVVPPAPIGEIVHIEKK
ncbi:hypothetical protein BMS3Bbin05_01340 [bacterium BMS3Bbin05]|nr:hypothetical protein BMS3Bbin05_01340 [bacterium BMS3Bbin05]